MTDTYNHSKELVQQIRKLIVFENQSLIMTTFIFWVKLL